MNVSVVAQSNNGETHQSSHVQRQDGNQQWLHTLQMTVQQDSHKNNLERGGEKKNHEGAQQLMKHLSNKPMSRKTMNERMNEVKPNALGDK